jgi:crotonobetainyl-CoA:carnitine CoA-transferase CaiB-like acyl-CoA transferase
MKPSLMLASEQLWVNGFFQVLDREEAGTHPYPGPVVRLRSTPAAFVRPAPLFGQHTREVLRDTLGLSDGELQALEDEGVTSTVPAPQLWR